MQERGPSTGSHAGEIFLNRTNLGRRKRVVLLSPDEDHGRLAGLSSGPMNRLWPTFLDESALPAAGILLKAKEANLSHIPGSRKSKSRCGRGIQRSCLAQSLAGPFVCCEWHCWAFVFSFWPRKMLLGQIFSGWDEKKHTAYMCIGILQYWNKCVSLARTLLYSIIP